MKPRTPLKRQSPQRSRDNAKYRHLKVKFLESHPYCFKCNDFIQPKYRTLHHFYGRVGKLLCFEPGFRMADIGCHNYIETHRREAIEKGWRANEKVWNRPSLVISDDSTPPF